jgi:hypothetical protein
VDTSSENPIKYRRFSKKTGGTSKRAQSYSTAETLQVARMVQHETELEMARRHVREGREILQRTIIEGQPVSGFSAAKAERLLSDFEKMQCLHEDDLERIERRNRCAERQRFTDWTFDKELAQIEDLLGGFDRSSPIADMAEARKQIAVLSIIKNLPEMDAAFPRFLGHDMHWWLDCNSLVGGSERWLKDLGIYDAVDAWSAAEHDWNRKQKRPRRQNPNLLAWHRHV